MKVNALLMDDRDNVVTCVTEIQAGSDVIYVKDGKEQVLQAAEQIPFCHKAALTDLPEGAAVIKYGELLGRTTQAIAKGHWVSDRNIRSVPRKYEEEYVKED